jgi:uncharacterized cupredoxin-like copper-binding protein
MFRKFAAAVIAAGLIAGPVLAQGGSQATSTAPATTGQPAAKIDAKVKTTETKVTKTKKHVAMIRHHRKHFAQVKHVKHVKYAKHSKHVKHLKQVKQSAKRKIAG